MLTRRNRLAKIRNQDENGVGEIWATAPYLMLGYFENKEATDEVIVDGWFNTGDLGFSIFILTS